MRRQHRGRNDLIVVCIAADQRGVPVNQLGSQQLISAFLSDDCLAIDFSGGNTANGIKKMAPFGMAQNFNDRG